MGVKVGVLDEPSDKNAEPGSRPWALHFVRETKMRRDNLASSVESLQRLIDKLKTHEAWKPLGYASFSMLCESKLDLSTAEIDAITKAKKGRTIGEVIPPLRTHGTNRFTENRDSKNENRISIRGGTNVEYRIAKLKRDAPEFADRLEAGEFGSVREAERAAGFPVPPKLTPLERAYRAAMRLTESDRVKLVAMIEGE